MCLSWSSGAVGSAILCQAEGAVRPRERTSMPTFRATIRQAGKSATGIPVPESVVAELGSGKKPAVVVRIGSYEYRSTVASMGGEFLIPLSAEHRAGSGVAGGDEVDV